MDPTLLTTALGMGRAILDRIFPDPAQRAAAEMELLKLQQEDKFKDLDDALQRSLAQTNINAIEAANPSLAVAGWRPALGWIGVATFGYQYLLRPMVPWICQATGHSVPDMPSLDGGMFELVAMMLGLSGMRSFDKLKGTS